MPKYLTVKILDRPELQKTSSSSVSNSQKECSISRSRYRILRPCNIAAFGGPELWRQRQRNYYTCMKHRAQTNNLNEEIQIKNMRRMRNNFVAQVAASPRRMRIARIPAGTSQKSIQNFRQRDRCPEERGKITVAEPQRIEELRAR